MEHTEETPVYIIKDIEVTGELDKNTVGIYEMTNRNGEDQKEIE